VGGDPDRAEEFEGMSPEEYAEHKYIEIRNPLYVHPGTSRGRLDLSPDFIGGFRTIYEVLWNEGVDSALIYHDWSSALTFNFLLEH